MTVIDRIHQFDKFGMVLGLERMEELLGRLGNPHEDLKVIHVAGTNGKGSVCKYLEMGLRGCGYKVGLFTSPYIEQFNERIRFDGKDISDEDLDNVGWKVIEAADKMIADGMNSPTEFEIVTAIAFLYFKEKCADIVVLEVGLGGSGDSTNVVKAPLASVITSISFDHTAQLGNTLGEIAANKAGIIKKGCPVISNVLQREASTVIARKAYEIGARLYDITKIKTAIIDETVEGQTVSMELYEKSYSGVEIPMVGEHQAQNLKTALATLEILREQRKIVLTKDGLYEGLRKAAMPGRFEMLKLGDDENPTIVIDGAHNDAGAESLEKTMKECFDGKILLVTGILADKEVDKILEHFTNITKDVIVTEPDNPRAMSVDDLVKHLNKFGVVANKEADIPKCIEMARSMGKDYDVILIAGSLYLIGTVRRLMK